MTPLAIVMEYLPLSLQQLLEEDCPVKQFRLPLKLVERWTQNLAEACQALHAERGIHRDIKPANIMFRWPTGTTYGDPESLNHAVAVLTDLGTVTHEGQVLGLKVFLDEWKDPSYFRAEGEARGPTRPLEIASDIYALGKVFDRLCRDIDGPSEWLERIARRCCQEPPNTRPSATDLLQQLSANEPIRAAERAGWNLELHPQFIGREWLRAERDQFLAHCAEKGHGGIMLVVGPAGVGKSALLTHWEAEGAPWPGYYFSFRETGSVKAMPEHIYEQIKHQLPADSHKPEWKDWTTKHFEAMLSDWSRANPSGRLLIFIDALDEAIEDEVKRDGPRLAAELLPKKLGPRVFLIVSSRPTTVSNDHLLKLRCDHLKKVELTPEDPRNKEDMTRYFATRLDGFLNERGQAEQLTEAGGGIFRLAVLLAGEIRTGKETVRGLLQRAVESWGKLPVSEKLFGFYRDDLLRALGEDLEPYFRDFARLVVAIQGWISEDEILRVLQHGAPRGLEWEDFQRDRFIRSLRWFLKSEDQQRDGKEKTVCYWPQHASVRDFLLADTPEFRGPARTGVPEMHSRIGNCFRQLAQDTGWHAVPYYGRLHAARHLLQSQQKDDYRSVVEELLCNPAYLQATLGDEPPKGSGTEAST